MRGRGLNRGVLVVLLVLAVAGAGALVSEDRPSRGALRLTLPDDATSGPSRSRAGLPVLGPRGVPTDPAGQLAMLLSARGDAVTQRSRGAWLATIDPRARSFAGAQRAVFGRILTVAPREWRYRFVRASALPPSRAAAAPGGWSAEVVLTYQLTPGGPAATRRQFLTLVPAPDASLTSTTSGWLIAGDTAGSTERDVWDLGPVTVKRASRCVVIGSATKQRLVSRIADRCGDAAQRVTAAWGGGWPARTVLVVPRSQEQLGTLLGHATTGGAGGADVSDGLDQTAAVTVGPADGPAEEVLVNPAVFDDLQQVGYRVILTHELTHVATRATGSRNPPTWLAEGFADYVGYSGTGLSPRTIAGDALEEVERGKIPSKLPPDRDFDVSTTGAAAAYGYAWVAADTIAKSGGTATLAAFYRAASGSGGTKSGRVDQAVRTVLKLDGTRVLIVRWQRQLRALAR